MALDLLGAKLDALLVFPCRVNVFWVACCLVPPIRVFILSLRQQAYVSAHVGPILTFGYRHVIGFPVRFYIGLVMMISYGALHRIPVDSHAVLMWA